MSASTAINLTPAHYKGEKYFLKTNGLPTGYALYWFFPQGKPKNAHADLKSDYIYTKFHGQGLSCKTKEWQKAVEFVKHLRSEETKSERAYKPSNWTIKQLLDNYVVYLEKMNAAQGDYAPDTAYNTRKVIESNLTFFAEIKADKLTTLPEKQDEYRTKRTEELMTKTGRSESEVQLTIDKELGILRAAYNRAVKQHKVHKSVVPLFDIDKANTRRGARDGMFAEEQSEILFKKLPEPVNMMLALDLVAGVRKKETTFIRRDAVNWPERLITLKRGEQKQKKNGGLVVFFSERLASELQAWEDKTKRLFPKAQFLFHHDGERMTTEYVNKVFNRTCEELRWHTPALDSEGNPLLTKHGRVRMVRSPRWHDSRRNATTASGELGEVKDLDIQRTIRQSPETQDRYDQKKSAIKVRDAVNRRDDMKAGKMPPAVIVAPALAKEEIAVEDKLIRLKSMFDRGLVPADIYQQKIEQMLAAF